MRWLKEAWVSQVLALEAEKETAQHEATTLKSQLEKALADGQLAIQVHDDKMRQLAAELQRTESRIVEMEIRHSETLSGVRQRHKEDMDSLAAELEAVQLRQTEASAALAARTASLEETERNRSSTVDHLAHLEQLLEKETGRAEAAMSDCNVLRTALTTATSEKHALCHRIQELSELLKTAKSVVLSTWQADADVELCPCGKLFTFSERKHHCRKCGQVYCDACTSRKVLQASSDKLERLCNSCHNLIESFRSENLDSVNSSFLRTQYASLDASSK